MLLEQPALVVNMFNFLWLFRDIPDANKRNLINQYISDILRRSDWTQLPDSGLSLSEQIAQAEIRAAWMELDDPNLDPDTIILPEYPLMERPQ